jgi:hypothetical protein
VAGSSDFSLGDFVDAFGLGQGAAGSVVFDEFCRAHLPILFVSFDGLTLKNHSARLTDLQSGQHRGQHPRNFAENPLPLVYEAENAAQSFNHIAEFGRCCDGCGAKVVGRATRAL